MHTVSTGPINLLAALMLDLLYALSATQQNRLDRLGKPVDNFTSPAAHCLYSVH